MTSMLLTEKENNYLRVKSKQIFYKFKDEKTFIAFIFWLT